ncbi:phospholipase D-like domain-containing protein [Chitinophaga nivalis]|uniref:phospholipase D n=1 Tax=Chitinophaga nivalis TaxID=2991709 RepID=A0ABT3IT04_9BACT|nr:phospholipase D-like domain-containing protein [Chitinophaga nivalis]MCW3463460.1 phospholipase D-like domain-containing protein [Chitinophaga nivalis]MCW3486850.1 phospholipase D-like domain-containing protein [Chitinophaga nivalis]
MELIDQQVINDNKEIYAKIRHELQQATTEIMVATGWFTDEDLFNILSEKLDQAVAIEIIIADNPDNEKLDFNQLAAKGAAVYKIKSNGYGMMNQKYCVIDKRIALHGSYNWTINAKKNNHESIISTNHAATIQALIENFHQVKQQILEQHNEPVPVIIKTELSKEIPVTQSIKAGTEFEKVLDAMIAAEIGSFDRKLIREQGFERCSANNGDHQVLYKAFDTLYAIFINDIDVIDDKKKRLIAKIEEYRIKSQDNLEKKCELQIDFLERENAITKTNLEVKGIRLAAEIEAATKNIHDIRDHKIPVKEQECAVVDKQIKLAEQATVKPRFKWFEFIPIVIFNAALLSYLLIFYSSAAYILLFSVEDAHLQEVQNIPVAAAQIFNPEALTKALSKPGTATFFIFLFVFIPLAFAIVDQFVHPKKKQLVSVLGFIFGIIVLDGAIAYKVTEAVYEVNYAQGNVTTHWMPGMVFKDTNFYLVFVFGASGLLLFKLAFKKLIYFFEERSPDIIAQRNQLNIKHLREEMAVHTNQITLLKENVMILEVNIVQLRVDVKHTELELRELPIRLNQDLQKKRGQRLKDAENIDKIAAIYTIHIQSDNLPVSVDALKDRINIFLEGWNDFLHQEYAIPKATAKTAQAAEVAARWQGEKLYISNIDKRVKITQDA